MDAGEKGRLQFVFYYRTGDETGELIWKNQGSNEDLPLAYLFPWLGWPVCAQEAPARLFTGGKSNK